MALSSQALDINGPVAEPHTCFGNDHSVETQPPKQMLVLVKNNYDSINKFCHGSSLF